MSALTDRHAARHGTVPPRSEPFTLMGVVNVTPDSFSDGGRYPDGQPAVTHGLELEAQGAAILDIGGESTRPGAAPVGLGEELRRVVPVIEGLQARGTAAALSVDTSKAAVASAAVAAGAVIVNDVTALQGDPEMAGVLADLGVECCLMHMQGTPPTMQRQPHYDDVVSEVKAFLEQRMAYAVGAGIAQERIVLDPGIGFGKTVAHNLELLRRLDELLALGRPVLVGTSRKGFLGTLTGREVHDRLPATIASNVLAFARGASLFRVHDVGPVRDALLVAAATVTAPWTTTPQTSSTT
jgi:dihydropteroate synthase